MAGSRTSLTSPRRLRVKYTHRTNLTICTLCISPLQGAKVSIAALTNAVAFVSMPDTAMGS